MPKIKKVCQALVFLLTGFYAHLVVDYGNVLSADFLPHHEQVENNGFNTVPSTPLSRKTVSKHQQQQYVPASTEKYIMNHLHDFGWDSEKNPEGCMIWNDRNHPLYNDLQAFLLELDSYQTMVRDFPPLPINLRDLKREESISSSFRTSSSKVCDQVKLGPSGVKGIFSKSGQLSLSQSGYIEPLTTPMRHPRFCSDRGLLMDMNYMVHDFQAMCEKIQPHSTTVLIDMGASLSYHDDQTDPLLHVDENPITYLLHMYEKFGIRFDHIYGLEAKFTNPDDVFQKLLPEEYMASYHWINTGVLKARKMDDSTHYIPFSANSRRMTLWS